MENKRYLGEIIFTVALAVSLLMIAGWMLFVERLA